MLTAAVFMHFEDPAGRASNTRLTPPLLAPCVKKKIAMSTVIVFPKILHQASRTCRLLVYGSAIEMLDSSTGLSNAPRNHGHANDKDTSPFMPTELLLMLLRAKPIRMELVIVSRTIVAVIKHP